MDRVLIFMFFKDYINQKFFYLFSCLEKSKAKSFSGIKIFIPSNGAKKCCHLTHTGVTSQKYSSHLVCAWGKVSSQGCHLVLDSSV